jgi:hypothetical protein
MPKKTSRAARTLQNQRDVDKKKLEAARPLVSSSSTLVDNEASAPAGDSLGGARIYDAPAPSPETNTSVLPPRPRSSTLPNRRPVAARQPAISREDEYRFVRSDLRTVFILTVLMVIALIVLTIVIGR